MQLPTAVWDGEGLEAFPRCKCHRLYLVIHQGLERMRHSSWRCNFRECLVTNCPVGEGSRVKAPHRFPVGRLKSDVRAVTGCCGKAVDRSFQAENNIGRHSEGLSPNVSRDESR